MEEGLEHEEKPAMNSGAGDVVRAARLAAGIDPAKLSAALRISTAALEAVEAGQYDRLPGEPYVRALLGSIARYLNLDAGKLLQTYNAEIGTKSEEVPARPYKDGSQIHILAHKKWFIALLVILLIALMILFGKINSSSDRNDISVETPPRTDSAANAATSDTLSENRTSQSDSLNGRIDSASKSAARPDTARAPAIASKIDTTHKVVTSTPPVKAHDSAAAAPAMNRLSVKALVDSVWMRVLRNGKPEQVILLRTGSPPLDIAHTDTITLILGKRRSVEIAYGDTTFVPSRKRFKLSGKKILYF